MIEPGIATAMGSTDRRVVEFRSKSDYERWLRMRTSQVQVVDVSTTKNFSRS